MPPSCKPNVADKSDINKWLASGEREWMGARQHQWALDFLVSAAESIPNWHIYCHYNLGEFGIVLKLLYLQMKNPNDEKGLLETVNIFTFLHLEKEQISEIQWKRPMNCQIRMWLWRPKRRMLLKLGLSWKIPYCEFIYLGHFPRAFLFYLNQNTILYSLFPQEVYFWIIFQSWQIKTSSR